MAVPREKIIVAAAGKDGDHAAQYYGHRDNVAQFGRAGANGQSASAPTHGGDGKDISVQLSYSEKHAPGAVIVEGTKAWKGTRWEVPSTQIILLNARGGDGGKGGNGQDGQQGGQGSRGRDATKHRDAEDGGMGANGGDGGYGTNGANGGNAGSVFITVNEDDLDLLLPMFWDIRGGKGGQSGSHGNPGDGGIGGDGGSGGTWVERHGDTKVTITKGPGRAGSTGRPGAPPPTYLQGGTGGTPGSSQVTVIRNNGTEATYPTRYELKVVSFDVVDENDDGIFEPGEHLLVKNIRVQNTGGMPSPSNHDIQVLIHGSHWLDPIVSESITLPKGIPVDEVVEVPGVLRAFIMQERVLRAPGQPLLATDEVQLIATMGRINRIVPEFTGSTKIEIKYPLQLDAPRFLDCVSPGDHITFSWTLRNISSKPYGIEGAIRRGCATALVDPGHLFNFVEAEGDNKHEMIDPLEVLDPGSEVPISQTFKVSDMAYPYSVGHLKLDLLLSEPGDNEARFSDVGYHEETKMRSIMSYPLVMQISGVYSLNPHSAFLLVVNSATPNSSIHQIIRFIREELKLHLDIFNLSVGGSFTDPATQQSVLNNYAGKSVIIFGNSFPYFGLGTKSAFDLLDPWNTCSLAKAGTNFHFAGATGNIEGLRSWATLTTFPIYAYDPNSTNSPENVSAPSVKEVIAQLHSKTTGPYCKTYPFHAFPSKKTLCGSPDSALASNAERAAKKLNKNFPLGRFAVIGDAASRTTEVPGTVVIREGFPRTASMTASLMEYGAEDEDLADYQKYMIISTLQFKARACMFWNMAGVLDSVGIDSTVLLSGKGLETFRTGVQVTVQEVKTISEKVCKAICLSIEYDLGREIGRFTHKAPSFDVIPKQNSISQLPLLNQFFDMEPPSDMIRSTERTQFIGQTLAVILCSLLPISGGESFRQIFMSFGDRKSRLRPQVVAKMDGFLAGRCAPEVVTYLKAEAVQNSKVMKKQIKAIQGATDTTSVSFMNLSTLTSIQQATFFDVTDINPTSVAWLRPVADGKAGEYNNHSMTMRNHEAHSKGVLNEMTSKIEA